MPCFSTCILSSLVQVRSDLEGFSMKGLTGSGTLLTVNLDPLKLLTSSSRGHKVLAPMPRWHPTPFPQPPLRLHLKPEDVKKKKKKRHLNRSRFIDGTHTQWANTDRTYLADQNYSCEESHKRQCVKTAKEGVHPPSPPSPAQTAPLTPLSCIKLASSYTRENQSAILTLQLHCLPFLMLMHLIFLHSPN